MGLEVLDSSSYKLVKNQGGYALNAISRGIFINNIITTIIKI